MELVFENKNVIQKRNFKRPMCFKRGYYGSVLKTRFQKFQQVSDSNSDSKVENIGLVKFYST